MKNALVLLPAVTIVLLAIPIDAQQVCKGDALPTIDDVGLVLDNRLDLSLAGLVGLEKTDGQLADVSGVKVYTIYYRADIQFVDSAFIMPLDLQRAQIAGDWFTISKPGPYMFKANHRAGERLTFAGTVEFDRSERGWRAGGGVYCGWWPGTWRMPIAATANTASAAKPDPVAALATSAAPADPRLFWLPTKSRANALEAFGDKADVKFSEEISGYAAGINFRGPGDAVAAADGRVVRIFDIGRKDKDFGLGNGVILEHVLESGDTLYSLYAHLAGFSSEVRMGQMLSRGTVIGPIGSSGDGREKYWMSNTESPRCIRPAMTFNPVYCVRLHFELKSKPVLENPSGEKVCRAATLFGSKSSLCYGYTPKDPTALGYIDPKTVIGRVRVKSASSSPDTPPPGVPATTAAVAAPTAPIVSDGPPMPFEDHGACPGESCSTVGQVRADKGITLLRDRNKSSPIVFKVREGEQVTALTDVLITTEPGRATVLKSALIGGVPANRGDIVFPLGYKGEGHWKAWYKGKLIDDVQLLEPDAKIVADPKNIWWVLIRNSTGQQGWSDEPLDFCPPPRAERECAVSYERRTKLWLAPPTGVAIPKSANTTEQYYPAVMKSDLR